VLSCSLNVATAQTLMCSDTDHLCDYHLLDGTVLHTPPDGTVLGATVDTATNFPNLIAFQVHYNTSMVSSIMVKYSDMDYRQAVATADTCPLPASFSPDPRENCSSAFILRTLPSTGIQSTVVAVLPISNAVGSSARSSLCFHGVSTADGTALPQRCVTIATIVSASFSSSQTRAFVDNIPVPIVNRQISALVGNKEGAEEPHVLRLDLSTDASAPTSAGDMVEIELKHDDGISAELPGQEWLGPTVNTNGVWTRSLEYTPTVSQLNKEFAVTFQVSTSGNAPPGADLPLNGVACGSVEGRCAADTTPGTARYRVTVLPFRTVFVEAHPGAPLFNPSTGIETGEFSSAAPPEVVSAFVNCPMETFGISAFAEVGATFGATAAGALSRSRPVRFTIQEQHAGEDDDDDGPSLAELGLSLSPTRMYSGSEEFQCGDATCSSDTNFFHTTVSWTPALAMMGRTRRLCVAAETATSATQTCFTLVVERCRYCTMPGDTLHSVAAQFDTDWLQLWSANFMGGSGGTHEMNPNVVAEGTQLRLGPVFRVRVGEDMHHLAQEFQTSVESLRRANRDLPEDAMMVPAQQELCVLPGICTQQTEWM